MPPKPDHLLAADVDIVSVNRTEGRVEKRAQCCELMGKAGDTFVLRILAKLRRKTGGTILKLASFEGLCFHWESVSLRKRWRIE